MSDEPEQSSSGEWTLTVDAVSTEIGLNWPPTVRCRIQVMTPDWDPVLVTLRMEVQLKDRPSMSDDDFAAWLGRLAADRLRPLPPLPKLPEPT